jgi:uncharacterized transporter YbjL
MTTLTQARIRYYWRTKYPWLFVLLIMLFAVLTGVLKYGVRVEKYSPEQAINWYMWAVFIALVSTFVAYIFGVRPVELEEHFK